MGVETLYFIRSRSRNALRDLSAASRGVFGFFIGAFSLIFDLYKSYHKSLVFPIVLFAFGVTRTYCGSWLRGNMPRVINRLRPWLIRCRPVERQEPIFFGTEALLESSAHHSG